jgi:hypothetical protein
MVQTERPSINTQEDVELYTKKFEERVEDLCQKIDNMKIRFYPSGVDRTRNYNEKAPGKREFNQLRTQVKSMLKDFKKVAKTHIKKAATNKRIGFNRLIRVSVPMAEFLGLSEKRLSMDHVSDSTKDMLATDEEKSFKALKTKQQTGVITGPQYRLLMRLSSEGYGGVYTQSALTPTWTNYINFNKLNTGDKKNVFAFDDYMTDLFAEYARVEGIDMKHCKYNQLQKVLKYHYQSTTVKGSDELHDRVDDVKLRLKEISALNSAVRVADAKIAKLRTQAEFALSKGLDEEAEPYSEKADELEALQESNQSQFEELYQNLVNM